LLYERGRGDASACAARLRDVWITQFWMCIHEDQFRELPFINRASLVLRYFSIISMVLVWVRRDCPNLTSCWNEPKAQ
jgi:hypothetical protein